MTSSHVDLLFAYRIFLETINKFKLNVPFFLSFQANGDAALGKYVAGSVSGASGDAGLFVANHAY